MEVAKRQKSTTATIDMHDPPNHDRYRYTFHLDDKRFSGWAYPNDKHDFSINEQIVVYYDPTDPRKNSPSSFLEVSAGDLLLVPFCLLAVAALPLFIFIQRRARTRVAETQPRR
jgi:hypothetical protein